MAQITRSEQDIAAAAQWADSARDRTEDEEMQGDALVSIAYSNLVIAGALGKIAELLDRQVNGA
jgi:hypothetical protein